MTVERLQTGCRYEVPAETELPSLLLLPKVVGVEPALRSSFEAIYSDTEDLALSDAGITLRRRAGGTDAGWHLRLPLGGDDRSDLVEPLQDDEESVPPELTAHLRAWVRDRELRTIATLSTRRVVHRLIGDAGKVLAEVSNDLVTTRSRRHGETVHSQWREWEIELVGGSRKLLTAADELFIQAGAISPAWPSKLHHALEQQPRTSLPGQLSPTDRSPAGAVVMAYVGDQIAVILTRDGDIRRDRAEAVDRVLAAVRRIRSALSTFRPLFDRERTDPIRVELGWLAASLRAVRDVVVQWEHLRAAAAAEPSDVDPGPAADDIAHDLEARHRQVRATLLAALESGRYFRLLDGLDVLVTAPPFTDFAAGRSRPVLRRRVRQECRNLCALVSLGRPGTDGDADRWLDEVRKAAGRVRYAAEAAQPALGRPVTALAAATGELEDLLGDRHDDIVMRATLRAVGGRMFLEGRDPFVVGRLHAFRQHRAEAAELHFTALWSARLGEHLSTWLGH